MRAVRQKEARGEGSILEADYNEQPSENVLNEVGEKKKDVAPAYILFSVESSCKASVRPVKCLRKA